MSNEKAGGPAFPTPSMVIHGMTLRDYFAGQALHGFCSIKVPDQRELDACARAAYAVADAMLDERAK